MASCTDASVSVGYDQPGRAISREFIGLSYESSALTSPEYLSPKNLSLLGLLRGLGPGGVLRLGGNMSESTVWRDTDEGNEGESFVITPAAVDQLAALLDALDWQLIYGLNLARGTPEEAADEAVYVASAVGSRLLAFQIGNEPDGFGRWRAVRPPTYDCGAFLAEWRQFHEAIRARLPNAPFAGPAIAVEQGWIRPFIEAARDSLVLVTRHHYADGPAGSPHLSLAKLLCAAPRVGAMLEEVLAINTSTGLPFRIAETNSIFNEGQPGVSDIFGSALWGLEFMFQLASAGAQGLNFHTGDAKAYTPIVPGARDRPAARPLYYGMLMFIETMRDAVLVSARLVAPDLNMAAFAARTTDGTLRVCLINKDLEQSARVEIDTGQQFERAALLRLTAPSAESISGVTLGDSAVDDFGQRSREHRQLMPWRNDSVVDVPPASAAMVEFSKNHLPGG
jgi:hypothetical protein